MLKYTDVKIITLNRTKEIGCGRNSKLLVYALNLTNVIKPVGKCVFQFARQRHINKVYNSPCK